MFSECVQRSYESVILPQVKLLTAKYEVIGSKGVSTSFADNY